MALMGMLAAIRVLRMLVEGHRQGRSTTEEEMTRSIPELSADEWRLLMDSLLDNAVVARLADGSWTLLKSARGVVVWDLFLALPQSLRPEHLVAEEWSEALPVLDALQVMADTGRESLTITLETLGEGPAAVLPDEPREALA